MARSLSVKMEEHAFFILFIAFIVVLFWHAVWELSNLFVDYLHEKHGVKKKYVYVVYLMIVILIIGLFPQVLEKI
jgi:succinate dehydrogenase hydrophobic anchor subunit